MRTAEITFDNIHARFGDQLGEPTPLVDILTHNRGDDDFFGKILLKAAQIIQILVKVEVGYLLQIFEADKRRALLAQSVEPRRDLLRS